MVGFRERFLIGVIGENRVALSAVHHAKQEWGDRQEEGREAGRKNNAATGPGFFMVFGSGRELRRSRRCFSVGKHNVEQ